MHLRTKETQQSNAAELSEDSGSMLEVRLEREVESDLEGLEHRVQSLCILLGLGIP